MARQRIFNHNRLGKYYWQTANIVDDLDLSVYAFRLYAHLVRISSISNVDVSTRALSTACKMSLGMVSDAKQELADANLISITKKPSGRRFDYDEISILDIAQRNIEHCQKRLASSPHELIESPHELIESQDELTSSLSEHLINNQEQTRPKSRNDRGAFAPIITPVSPDASVANATAKTDFDALAREAGIHNQSAPPRKPRKLATNLTLDTTDDECVKAYLRILCQDEITQTNAGMITKRVSDLGLWVATLEQWARGNNGMSYNPTNFSAMFDNYDRRVIAANTPKTTTGNGRQPLAEPAGFAVLRQMMGSNNGE
jgi:hypothetical protein